MGWTTPRTYIVGEQITAAILNTHIRDQSTFLGTTHAHGTASGDGTAEMNPDRVEFGTYNIIGAGVIISTLNGTSFDLTYGKTAPSQVIISQINPASGTVGLFTLGSDGTEMAPGNHSH
jgi:hypothetical protein